MASAVDTNKVKSNIAVTSYDFDPDATTATDVAWVDMRDFENILFQFIRTVGTSDVTVKVLANAEADGSGTDVEIKSLTNAQFGDPDAFLDYAFVECSAEEIAHEAAKVNVNARYVSLNLAFATSTDEAVVTYIRVNPKHARDGLTVNNIA